MSGLLKQTVAAIFVPAVVTAATAATASATADAATTATAATTDLSKVKVVQICYIKFTFESTILVVVVDVTIVRACVCLFVM